MKPYPGIRSKVVSLLLSFALAAGLALPLRTLAVNPLALANSPLATSTTSTVKPNVLLVLDDSGSMAWDHLPDGNGDGGSSVLWNFGYYGVRSSQCNMVYYDPTINYQPPVHPDGTSYPNMTFYNALSDGYVSTSTAVNLNTGFKANQTGLSSPSVPTDATAGQAYYYAYSGTQLTPLQKNHNVSSGTFYDECNSALGAVPGVNVFTKVTLGTVVLTVGTGTATNVSSIKVNGVELMGAPSIAGGTNTATTAGNIAAALFMNGFSATLTKVGNATTPSEITITGPASAIGYTPVVTKGLSAGTMTLTVSGPFPNDSNATHLTNFANWYSYYRTRILMMRTAAGIAFSSLGNGFRVGFMKISSSGAPTVPLDTFWNNTNTTLGPASTQRTDWYNALYAATPGGSTPLRTALSDAGRYYAGKLSGVTDPLQYSCQQNFTIMSTDGYWNTGTGYGMDGSTAVGNQDGTAEKPMWDGATPVTNYTFTYTRDNKTKVTGGCTGGKSFLKTQPQIGTCVKTVATGSCTPTNWANNGAATTTTVCASNSASTTTPVQQGTPTQTAGATSGGSSDSLSDVAMYYYQNDLRTPALNNCTGAVVPPATSGSIICSTANPDPYNNVFKSATDTNQVQHMNTFTLALGAPGKMNYSSSYLADTSGDYYSIKLGLTADSTASPPICPWQANGTVCTWPMPGMSGSNGLVANIDDLWHAAVDGRGAYFSATDPTTLAQGLSGALASINAKIGSAAAAATSTLNPVAGNNFAYVASYTTVLWQGNLEARGINVDTGVVDQNATWCVENVAAQVCPVPGVIAADSTGATTIYTCDTPNQVICNGGDLVSGTCKVPIATACIGTMNAMVTDTTDTRHIYTINAAGTGLTSFDAAYAAANPANFSAAKLSALTQWPLLNAGQQNKAVNNLVNFLRGQHGYEENRTSVLPADQIFRNRQSVMGDALESQPAYIGPPVFSYPYPGYSAYFTAEASRAGTVFMGTNDGMLHAFDAATGIERWAYVPSMVIPNMWRLADTNYAQLHVNLVNGSPITSDVCFGSYCNNAAYATTATTADDPVWKTILVGGLNGGGRGYYALDITNPTTPALLWEFTPAKDKDLGYSYGQPVITKKADGTWVVLVTSGYDNGTDGSPLSCLAPPCPALANSPAGSGIGYLYVLNAQTGAIISKISTNVGTASAPSGLAKIAGYNAEPLGNAVNYVYGGDLLGNVWRFDINSTTSATIGKGTAMKFATLFSDTAGLVPQSVTTTPILGNISGRRVVFIGTGKYLEVGDLTTTQKQTQYGIEDYDATTTLVNPRTTLVNQTLTNTTSGTRNATGNTVNWFTGRGWYVDFPDTGERVNIDAKLIQGTLLVPSIVPSNTVCSPGGYGWMNFFDYNTGGSVTPIPGTPLAGLKYDSTIVGVNVLYIQGQPVVEVVTSTNPTPQKDPDVAFKQSPAGYVGKRVTWREMVP